MPSPTQCAIFVVRLLYNRTFLVTQPVFVLWWKKIRNRKSRWCCLYNWSILRFIYICLLLGATVCVHSASCLRPQEERKLWACKKEHECKWNICIFLFHIFIGASATIFSFIEFSFWVFFQKKWDSRSYRVWWTSANVNYFALFFTDENGNKLAPLFVISSKSTTAFDMLTSSHTFS